VIMKSALVATTLVLAAAGAQAHGSTYWSIGINAPLQPGVSIGTVFSNAPIYPSAPAYYPSAPVVYAEPAYYPPAPVYVRSAPVIYLSQPYYTPYRGVYATGWAAPHDGHGHDRGHGRSDHRQGHAPVMTRYGER